MKCRAIIFVLSALTLCGLGASAEMTFSPRDPLYPLPIANPIRPTFALTVADYIDSEIPDTGDSRYILRLGGRYGFVRWHSAGEPDSGVQLDIAGAFIGQFDIDDSLDNIGWDGIYGVGLAWADGTGWSAELALQHDSAHLGDEYVEETERTRIDYTREEICLGISRDELGPFRIYAEAGLQHAGGEDETQDPWRAECGIEFEGEHAIWRNGAVPYIALDVGAYQESDWGPDFTVQAGLALHVDDLGRVYRLGIEYRNGRCILGEFFQETEEYVSIGVWMDL